MLSTESHLFGLVLSLLVISICSYNNVNRLVCWSLFGEDFIKLNCNVAFFKSSRCALCDGVIHDILGAFINVFSCSTGTCTIVQVEHSGPNSWFTNKINVKIETSIVVSLLNLSVALLATRASLLFIPLSAFALMEYLL